MGNFGYPPPPGHQAPGQPGYPPAAGPSPYGPPGYPPVPGQYYGGAIGMPGPSQDASGMAVASLVLSLLTFLCGITAPVGLILGLIELGKIKRGESGANGRPLAIAGTIIGGIFTGLMVLYLLGVVVFAIIANV